MCEVEELFASRIDEDDVTLALAIYAISVTKFANKNYKRHFDNAHTELAVIFQQHWICSKQLFFGIEYLKQANYAFNIANLQMGVDGKFIETAESLLDADEIADKNTIAAIAKDMDALLEFV